MSKIALALPEKDFSSSRRVAREILALKLLFVSLILLLSGCSRSASSASSAANAGAYNHVAGQNINWFSVNGYRVPGLGGGYCCVMIPDKWQPGMKVRVEWETDPKTAQAFPGYQNWEKYLLWEKTVKSSFQQHHAMVDIPEYEHACRLTVHFLPCNEVKATTSCTGYGDPGYPIKEPLNMKEPAVCPK